MYLFKKILPMIKYKNYGDNSGGKMQQNMIYRYCDGTTMTIE